MKEQKNKDILTKSIYIIAGIISIFLLIINFIPVFIIDAGIDGRFTGAIFSDSEVYVNKSNPDKNYADNYEGPYIGNYSEVYIKFNLEKLPIRTEEIYFFLQFFYFEHNDESAVDDIEINIILVESNWTDSKITWNNKPKHEGIIATLNITDIYQYPFVTHYNFERAVSITELINVGESKDISFCLNITENNEELNTSAYIDDFGLIWTYKKIILSYTTIISTIIVLSLLILMFYFTRKNLFNCQACGSKRILEDKFCRSCGLAFKENILIKSRDYQLILIILLIFVFLEVSFVSILFSFTTGPFMFFLALPILLWVIFCLKLIKTKISKYKKLKSSLTQT
ncbi:MAG: DNRLRE domain-containing protein [Promethearchaeota archaeon]